ncbi:hypothetical protein [Streptomyces soliscabiei]|uniref:hypothetical protein n=1 Tax=Streptomyces soliscabiei TaxID=588897 RepID=UPI0029B1B166|nr:hypothetical protein [Streptomyces sp. NY05-11A]MDX2675011.1 hypothetical protein [Streptomyces sp. NY05-11A]
MSSVEQTVGSIEGLKARQQKRGTTSFVLGAAAVAMLMCPFLPAWVPNWFRFFPVYFIVPAGIGAVVSGLVALHRARRQEEATPSRARVGVALGTTAVVLSLTVIVWAIWALNQAYK